MTGPAYTIITDRITMRCLHPEDATQLKQAIDESLEHLKKWMKWAKYEPEPLDFKVERIRKYRAKFDLDQQYTYGIFLNENETEKLIGIARLTSKHFNGDFEIGYWMHKDYLRKGFTTYAIKALVKTAFVINEVERLEIHCDPKNLASNRIPEKVGFINEGITRKSDLKDGVREQSMVWSMFIEEYHNSDLKGIKIEAYDAIHRKLL